MRASKRRGLPMITLDFFRQFPPLAGDLFKGVPGLQTAGNLGQILSLLGAAAIIVSLRHAGLPSAAHSPCCES